MTVSVLSLCETWKRVNIAQHRTLNTARQLWFHSLASDAGLGQAPIETARPGISDAKFRLRGTRQPTAAMAASERTKRTTTTISANVNVPRVKTFNAAAIAM